MSSPAQRGYRNHRSLRATARFACAPGDRIELLQQFRIARLPDIFHHAVNGPQWSRFIAPAMDLTMVTATPWLESHRCRWCGETNGRNHGPTRNCRRHTSVRLFGHRRIWVSIGA
jgi:hypothetical protein